jgi:hypothetical protein
MNIYIYLCVRARACAHVCVYVHACRVEVDMILDLVFYPVMQAISHPNPSHTITTNLKTGIYITCISDNANILILTKKKILILESTISLTLTLYSLDTQSIIKKINRILNLKMKNCFWGIDCHFLLHILKCH